LQLNTLALAHRKAIFTMVLRVFAGFLYVIHFPQITARNLLLLIYK